MRCTALSTLFPYTTLFRSVLGQPGLWAHGISGDLPILLVRVVKGDDIPLVRQVLQAQEYWRLKGLSARSEEHTSELQSHSDLVCRLLLEKKNFRGSSDCSG